MCLPSGCDENEIRGLIQNDPDHILNFGRYLISEKFFNYSYGDFIVSNVTKVKLDNMTPYQHDNLLDTLVTITILTVIFCIVGGYVEMSNMFDKPN